MGIGLSTMKSYFAEKGTGNVGNVLELEDKTTLKKEKRLLWKKSHYNGFGECFEPLATRHSSANSEDNCRGNESY